MKISLGPNGTTHLDVNFVPAEYNRDVVAHPDYVIIPVGDVIVRDRRGKVEHDYRTLSLDVIAVPQRTVLFLSGSVPHVETNLAPVGVEGERVDYDSQSGCVGTM